MEKQNTIQERKFFAQLFELLAEEQREYYEMQKQASEEYVAEIWEDAE